VERGERLWWPWLAVALGAACAGGAETQNTTFGPGPASGNPQTTTATATPETDDGRSTTGSQENDESDEGFDDTTTGPPQGDTTTTGPIDEGTTGDDEGSSSEGGSMGNCSNALTCPMASSIGSIAGDQGADLVNTSGSEPTWVTFQVAELDEDIVGVAMSFTVTLTSPAGADFDLYVYRGVEGGVTGCGGFLEQSTGAGVDTVSMLWGEGLVANGLDDDVWVAVEIVAKNDMCVPPQEWTLVAEGNT